MSDFSNQCYVCGIEIDLQISKKNKQLNLPVCDNCIGTDREKNAIEDYLEGMAE